MIHCPYCPRKSPSGESNRGHIRRHHLAESRANSLRRSTGDATDDRLELCVMCKLYIMKEKINTPSGLQRAHDSSTCHMQNLAHRGSEQHSSSGHGPGDDVDDYDDWNDGGNEDDDLFSATSGEAEGPELRPMDSRYGGVLERFERGSDRFRGDDDSSHGHGERNIHDWLGRNDRVVNAEYPIGEVFLLPVVTSLYWKYNRGDGIFRIEHLETSSKDWTTYGRMRILKLRNSVCRQRLHAFVSFIFFHSRSSRYNWLREPALS